MVWWFEDMPKTWTSLGMILFPWMKRIHQKTTWNHRPHLEDLTKDAWLIKHDNVCVCVCISTRLNTSLITTGLSLAKPEFNQQQMVGKSTVIYVFGQIHVSPLIIEFSWKWNIWYDQKKTIWHTKKVTYIMFPTNNDLWLAWLLTCPYDPYVYIHMLSLKKYPHLSIVIPNIPLYLPSC